jgi:tRNA nucleotidyltransferase/poly(A) polymerase
LKPPLGLKLTIYDDPLRILRSVRFMLKFNFKIEDSLKNEIIADDYLRQLFYEKIHRERVGNEIDNCFKVIATQNFNLFLLKEIQLLNYFTLTFFGELPNSFNQEHPLILSRTPLFSELQLFTTKACDIQSLISISVFLEERILNSNYKDLINKIMIEKAKNKPVQFLKGVVKLPLKHVTGGLFLGFSLLPFADHYTTIFNKWFLFKKLQSQLKISNKFVLFVIEIQSNLMKIKLVSNQLQKGPSEEVIFELGILLKNLGIFFEDFLNLALLGEIITFDEKNMIVNVVLERNIQKALERKPFYNGQSLKTTFKLKGKQIKDALNFQEKWLILNPEGSLEQFRLDFSKLINN